MLNQLDYILTSIIEKSWSFPQIDSFLHLFFTEYLNSSKNIELSFNINEYSSMISLFLKNKLKKFERINYLINIFDKRFFIDENVQRIMLQSQQYKDFIDQLIEDNKCVTLEKLSNEINKIHLISTFQSDHVKFPGLNVNLLNYCFRLLTGKQQEHITKIILNDYLQVIYFIRINIILTNIYVLNFYF